MSRENITSQYVSASVAVVQPEYLVYLDFGPTGSEAAPAPVRLWSGIDNQTFTDFSGTATYIGVGGFGAVSQISETAEVAAKGIEFTLSGIPSEYISGALQCNYRGRTAACYLLLYNSDKTAYQQTMVFRGRMNQMVINEGETTSNISVECESRLIELMRARETRYTDEYQKSIHPNDTGLEFIAGMADKVLYWGNTGPTSTVAVPGVGGGGDGEYPITPQ